MFFGREDDFAYIRTRADVEMDGGMVVLCGARRSGKTSILFQIQDGRLGDRFVPVLIDMQSMTVRSDAEFLQKLQAQVCDAVRSVGVGCEPDAPPFDENNPYVSFEKLTASLVARLGDRRILLSFDEYELFETKLDSGVLTTSVLNVLATLIEHYRVFILFTGSDQLRSRKRPYWNSFLTKALHRRISFLTRDDTLRLIREPLAGQIEYADGVAEAIADLTAGQPFYTQVLCQNVVDRLNELECYEVTGDVLEDVVAEVVENPLPQMIFHWNALAREEKFCLAVLASVQKRDDETVSAADLRAFAEREHLGYNMSMAAWSKTLEGLFHGDLVNKEEGEDRYAFKMGLWRRWVSRMHSVWQVVEELDATRPPKGDEGELLRESASVGRVGRRRTLVVVAGLVAGLAMYAGTRWMGAMDGGAPDSVSVGGGGIPRASVRVVSDPSGADVWIDGRYVARTPFADSIGIGMHALRVALAGYAAKQESIRVQEGENNAYSLTLEPLRGTLVVQSKPAGASVWLDGTDTGRETPLRMANAVAAGPHGVSLHLKGYESKSFDRVVIEPGSTTTLSAVLVRRTAPLAIRSIPDGARFEIDAGRWAGECPAALAEVPWGRHTVRVMRSGFATVERMIEVPVPDNRLVVSLERLPPGYLEFRLIGGADVWVDGVPRASEVSHIVLEQNAGPASIVLRHGLQEKTITVTVPSGDTLAVEEEFH